MDYYEAKEYASDIGKQSGFGAFCLLMVVMISYERGIPPVYVWLCMALVGLVAYSLVGIAVRTWAMARITVVGAEPAAERFPVPLPVVPEINGVDWIKLLRYLQQPDAALSRSALTGAGIVSQRAYSPVDGSLSFPDRMVEIGAAVRVSNGNAPPAYAWTSKAKEIVRGYVVKNLASRPPSPAVDVTGISA